MSITIMTEVWRADLPTGRKMVLLSLADNANDRGECYPSIEAVATRCGMSVRAVQGHVAELEKAGMLSRQERVGRSNLFVLHPRRICTPAESAPPQNLHPRPAESAPPPAESAPPTPAESAPITVIEPSLNRQLKHQRAARADVVASVFGLTDVDPQVLADWVAHRKRRKADVTATVVQSLRAEAAKAGMSVESAMRMQLVRGWTGFEADWVAGQQGRAPAQRGAVESFAERRAKRNAQQYAEFTGRPVAAAQPVGVVVDVPANVVAIGGAL
jgi:hypothetical protein